MALSIEILHTHTHTHTETQWHTHTHTDTHACTQTHTHMHTHMHTHTYRHTQTHTRTHTYRHSCMHTDTHTCAHTHTHNLEYSNRSLYCSYLHSILSPFSMARTESNSSTTRSSTWSSAWVSHQRATILITLFPGSKQLSSQKAWLKCSHRETIPGLVPRKSSLFYFRLTWVESEEENRREIKHS